VCFTGRSERNECQKKKGEYGRQKKAPGTFGFRKKVQENPRQGGIKCVARHHQSTWDGRCPRSALLLGERGNAGLERDRVQLGDSDWVLRVVSNANSWVTKGRQLLNGKQTEVATHRSR